MKGLWVKMPSWTPQIADVRKREPFHAPANAKPTRFWGWNGNFGLDTDCDLPRLPRSVTNGRGSVVVENHPERYTSTNTRKTL
jgi:hypothetical protein